MGRNWMVENFLPGGIHFYGSRLRSPAPILIPFRAGMAAIDWARRNQEGEGGGMREIGRG